MPDPLRPEPETDALTVHLSLEDERRFVGLLLDPPPPTTALQRAENAHAELIQGF